jgi:hypothetical protein
MTDKKEGGRNVADYQTVKSDLYAAYKQFQTSLNAYAHQTDPDARGKLLRRIRRALLDIYGIGWPSRNISKEVADKARKLRGRLFEQSWEKNKGDLEHLYFELAASMGEQGFLDTRLDEDQVVDNEDEDIPDMFK